jgi:anaerobic magnesium-protoporphyrin IX monomethyl ester cyclase
MLGCLKAFAKSGFERKFYDLGRVGYTGPQSLDKVDFGFDATRELSRDQIVEFSSVPRGRRSLRAEGAAVKACGGGTEQLADEAVAGDTGGALAPGR